MRIIFTVIYSITLKQYSMKKISALLCLLVLLQLGSMAQERYANTLNLGLGIGYYGYVGHSLPVFHLNYELGVAKNFTLAPFVTFYSYHNKYYWGSNNHPYGYYSNNVTVIPIGVKGTYYFDDVLNANTHWDFYLGASLGFTLVNNRWDSNYFGDRNIYRGSSNLYLDLHIGTEYHLNNRLGIFLDLSSGVSTVGLAIHSTK